MKANKVTFSIKVEVLHPDSIPGLLYSVLGSIEGEFKEGSLVADDGDNIEWSMQSELVEI